jgi:hypothetical protein
METIVGRGHPEGIVKAEGDTLYLDASSGLFYRKESSSGADDPNDWIEAGASSRDYSFAEGDSTPDVSGYKRYRTNNNAITNFLGGRDGQVIYLIVDRNTVIEANANIDMGFVGPGRIAFMLDASKWYPVPLRNIP